MQLNIPTMTCSGCARTVTAAIRSIDSAATVKADPETRKVEVETTATAAEIEAALASAGFPVSTRVA